MNTENFFQQLDARIAKFDLLCHPFYKAWARVNCPATICGNMRETTTTM